MRRSIAYVFSGICLTLSIAFAGGCAALVEVAIATNRLAQIDEDTRQGRYAEAIPKARELLASFERQHGPNHPNVAVVLGRLAELYRLTGDLTAARPTYERALRIFEQAHGPNHPNVAVTLYQLGRLYAQTGDYARARSSYERALRIHERVHGPNHSAVAETLAGLAELYGLTGDYTLARSTYERALAILERAHGPNHWVVAQTLLGVGVLYAATSDYALARSTYGRALRIFEQAQGPNHPAVGETLGRLAQLHGLTGDYVLARSTYERALRILEQASGPNHPAVGNTLNGLAELHRSSGDYALARSTYERALRILEQAYGPNHPAVGHTLNGLGYVLVETGDYARGKPLLERALRIREALGLNDPGVATILNSLAVFHRRIGDYAGARPLYERALRIFEQASGPNNPNVAGTLNNLAEVLALAGDYAAAKPLYERALKTYEQLHGPNHPHVALILNDFAGLLKLAGDYAAAKPLYERALRIHEQAFGPNHRWVAESLNGLAELLRLTGDYTAARLLHERALSIGRQTAVPESRWRAAFGLGRTYEQEARLPEALPLYQEAVRTLEGLVGQFGEEVMRAQYLQTEDRLAAYDALARLLLRLHEQDASKGYDREAWAVLEAKKGRLAAEALATVRPKLQDPQVKVEAEKVTAKQDQALALEGALRQEQAKPPQEQAPERVRNLTTLLAQTKAEYLAQVQAFLQRYPQYKTQFVDQQTVDPKALAKFADRLPAGTLVVQYFAAPDKLYLFVVAPGGRFQVRSHDVSQRDLYALVKQYRQYLERAASERLLWDEDRSEAYRSHVVPLKLISRQLAAHLLDPIEPELRAHRNLILIPNDLLLYLPIHALTREQPDGSVRFLAQTHAVSYVTQLELVDLLKPEKPVSNAPLLALSNPDGSLPGATREIRALRPIRPNLTVLEGPEATKARFLSLAAQFPDLHLATHGVLDPRRPERSYLLMAGDGEASQRLGIDEIAGLSLRNGLAILSACDTALGEQVPGAALITLAAAFSQAGSESIVASLWKVNDAATRDFMVAFHRALPTVGRAAALQEAQVTVLTNPLTAHPYYWAPFILIGAR